MQKHRRLWLGLILLAAALLMRPSAAQVVIRGDLTGTSTSRRVFERAAEKQGRSDFFVSPYTSPGTQVRITFDEANADITLVTSRDYSLPRLLSDAQGIARKLDSPRADYITTEGSKTISVDIELNKYLRRQPRRTEFTLPFAALAAALRSSSLPAPIVIGVNPTAAESVTLQTSAHTRLLDGITFYGLTEVPADARLSFLFTPLPYAAPLGIGLLVLLLLVPLDLWRAMRRGAKTPPAAAPSIPAITDPEEIQRRYDKGKPRWIVNLLPLLIGLPVLLLRNFNMSRLMGSWHMLSPVPLEHIMFGVMGLALLTTGGAFLSRRFSRQPVSVEEASNRAAFRPFTPLMIMPLLLMIVPLLLMVPVYTPQAAQIRRVVMLSVLALVPLITLAYTVWWRRRLAQTGGIGARKTLTEGVWYEMVQEMAARAGVSIRRVVLITSPLPNAYASVLRTVGLTTGLLEKLEPEEVRAVIAHEIGHLKARHPERILAGSLLVFTLIWGGWEWLRYSVVPHLPGRVAVVFEVPFLFFIVSNLLVALMIGPIRRRCECEADRRAVEWIGDPEVVIRALTRVSQGIGNPARLKRSDEALSNHPSLQNRVNAIRRGVWR